MTPKSPSTPASPVDCGGETGVQPGGVGELLPCPFCGGEAKLISGSSSTVQCQNDQCIIGDPAPFNDFSHRADAVAAWNTRLSAAPTPPRSDAWREAVQLLRERGDECMNAPEGDPLLVAGAYLHGAANDLEIAGFQRELAALPAPVPSVEEGR